MKLGYTVNRRHNEQTTGNDVDTQRGIFNTRRFKFLCAIVVEKYRYGLPALHIELLHTFSARM